MNFVVAETRSKEDKRTRRIKAYKEKLMNQEVRKQERARHICNIRRRNRVIKIKKKKKTKINNFLKDLIS